MRGWKPPGAWERASAISVIQPDTKTLTPTLSRPMGEGVVFERLVDTADRLLFQNSARSLPLSRLTGEGQGEGISPEAFLIRIIVRPKGNFTRLPGEGAALERRLKVGLF